MGVGLVGRTRKPHLISILLIASTIQILLIESTIPRVLPGIRDLASLTALDLACAVLLGQDSSSDDCGTEDELCGSMRAGTIADIRQRSKRWSDTRSDLRSTVASIDRGALRFSSLTSPIVLRIDDVIHRLCRLTC
jgi:hypothetical protein